MFTLRNLLVTLVLVSLLFAAAALVPIFIIIGIALFVCFLVYAGVHDYYIKKEQSNEVPDIRSDPKRTEKS